MESPKSENKSEGMPHNETKWADCSLKIVSEELEQIRKLMQKSEANLFLLKEEEMQTKKETDVFKPEKELLTKSDDTELKQDLLKKEELIKELKLNFSEKMNEIEANHTEKCKHYENKIERLKKDYAHIKQDFNDKCTKTEKKQLKVVESQLESAKSENTRHKSTIKSLESRLSSNKTELDKVETESNTMKRNYKFLLDKTIHFDLKEKSLETKLENLEKENSKLKEDVELFKSKLSSSNSKLQEMNMFKAENTSLKTDLTTLKEKYDKLLLDFNEETKKGSILEFNLWENQKAPVQNDPLNQSQSDIYQDLAITTQSQEKGALNNNVVAAAGHDIDERPKLNDSDDIIEVDFVPGSLPSQLAKINAGKKQKIEIEEEPPNSQRLDQKRKLPTQNEDAQFNKSLCTLAAPPLKQQHHQYPPPEINKTEEEAKYVFKYNPIYPLINNSRHSEPCRILRFCNLNIMTNEGSLLQAIHSFAPVLSLNIVRDHQSGSFESKGLAYVYYASIMHSNMARLALNGHLIDGVYPSITFCFNYTKHDHAKECQIDYNQFQHH